MSEYKNFRKATITIFRPTASGEPAEIILREKDQRPSLKELQDMVGGYIQVLPLERYDDVYVNEEGEREELPVNDNVPAWIGWDGPPILGPLVVLLGFDPDNDE